MTCRHRRRPHIRARRPGTAMIVAIIALLLTSTICFSLVRLALAANQQSERQGWRLQSVWLAESALMQATTRLAADADFTGDDWTIDNIGTAAQNGRVNITIATSDDTQERVITATADFPDDETNRVRTTRVLTLGPK